MSYIVFDTEFTSWKGSMQNNWSKLGEHRELVQIGALKIQDGKIIEKLNIFIKPKINPVLSDYFIKLTGITNEHLDKYSQNIFVALDRFYEFSKNCIIYSYGNDYSIIEENLLLNSAPMKSKYFSLKWKEKFRDFKELLYDYDINSDKYTSGTIYKAFNLKLDNTHKVHNALDDAFSLYITSKYILEDNI